MATRISTRRWLLRDIPRVGVLSVWALIGFGILLYCFDWPALERAAISHWPSRATTMLGTNSGNYQKPYTGSILFVPTRGDLCSQWIIDNRNGRMWDNGQVNCSRSAGTYRADDATPASRMLSIGRAFKGD